MQRFEARKKIVFTRREPEPGCSPAEHVEGRIVSGALFSPPRSRRGADVRMLHGSSDARLGPRTVAIASLWRQLLQSSAPSLPSMVQTQALCCGGIRRTLCAALWSRTPLPPQLRVIDAAPNPDYARERSAHLAFCVGFQEVESGTPDLVGEVLGIN